jgi:hypothetical protein
MHKRTIQFPIADHCTVGMAGEFHDKITFMAACVLNGPYRGHILLIFHQGIIIVDFCSTILVLDKPYDVSNCKAAAYLPDTNFSICI